MIIYKDSNKNVMLMPVRSICLIAAYIHWSISALMY